ncbi:GspE/PulE family protein [Denitratisoma oestradiolicum]|uniref:Type II secretion system protein E n=1 Tax=Denitratisoma oestradiolicum TaxID=311182 RepID=A0A6S6YIM6_9PROT|nr:GspE/PulE family protein [Denitratisoma oestradiolicum]TWO80524.1 MSHA biogenesis protein MshE [Denitratisoma oestradiolicum]CAB1367594.1 Type II secretion system protein E [Denitratisoma oestradiolicum]
MARPEKVRLGDLLIQQGLLTDEQLKLALEEQKRSGRKLGRIFVESGYVTEEGIARALARQLQVEFVDLRSFHLKPELIKLLPEAQARRYRALVLDERAGLLRVGLSDPTDLAVFDEISRVLRRDVELAVVTESQLMPLLDRVYKRTEEISGLAKELTQEMGDIPVEFGAALGITPGSEDAPVVKLLQTVFEEALRSRASDIHIEPQEKSVVIRFRIDGVLHVQTEADSKISTALVLRLKLMSGLDISEKRLPQDGRFNIKIRGQNVDVRISTMPVQHGESVVMRLLAQNTGLLELDSLYMPQRVRDRFHHAISRPSGIVLVTGPTGSGKTTTLYAALNELNTPEKKIITVEDPVEYRLPGLNQVQVHEKIDLTFTRVLRTALRQDPDIILIGEMRDQETAEIGMRAAMTGHLVLSTLHTNDALSTPIRLLDMGVPRYMVALSIQMVLAQRLVRVICENCATDYQPEPHEREWLRYELGDRVDKFKYRIGLGCAHCANTGYQGRQAVYEFLEMTNALVEAANHGDPSEFMAVGREQMAGHTLRRDAVRLVVNGRTTVEEAMRIATQLEE